jgi:hypothetical protein
MGIAAYGVCQTICNKGYVVCCAGLGYTAGTFSLGAWAPPALVACSIAQSVCMAACAKTFLATGIAGALAAIASAAAATTVFGRSIATFLGLATPPPTLTARLMTAASNALVAVGVASPSFAWQVYEVVMPVATGLLVAYALLRLFPQRLP